MRPFPLTVLLLVALGAGHPGLTEPAEVGSLSIGPPAATEPMGGISPRLLGPELRRPVGEGTTQNRNAPVAVLGGLRTP